MKVTIAMLMLLTVVVPMVDACISPSLFGEHMEEAERRRNRPAVEAREVNKSPPISAEDQEIFELYAKSEREIIELNKKLDIARAKIAYEKYLSKTTQRPVRKEISRKLKEDIRLTVHRSIARAEHKTNREVLVQRLQNYMGL